jgi:ribosomal protein S18 acetylase RimI-like enzyme
MDNNVKLASSADIPAILAHLRREPGSNAWALQDLQVWPEATQMYVRVVDGQLNYMMFTGHPGAQRGGRPVLLRGTPEGVQPLLAHLPPKPYVVRETPNIFREQLVAIAPDARVFTGLRMEATRATFKPRHTGRTRRLTVADAAALAKFNNAPEAAIPSLIPWIEGAIILGVFNGDELLAMASTFVRVPEVWELVAISTRPDLRGQGLGAEVTSALTALALAEAPVVTLTLVKANTAALKLYESVGYYQCEDRVWFDNGLGSAPGIA